MKFPSFAVFLGCNSDWIRDFLIFAGDRNIPSSSYFGVFYVYGCCFRCILLLTLGSDSMDLFTLCGGFFLSFSHLYPMSVGFLVLTVTSNFFRRSHGVNVCPGGVVKSNF